MKTITSTQGKKLNVIMKNCQVFLWRLIIEEMEEVDYTQATNS